MPWLLRRIGSWLPSVLATVGFLAVGGCALIRTDIVEEPEPVFDRVKLSEDSCVLDVFFVRFALGDEANNGPLWEQIDEQHIPADVRRRLAQNGFRAGLVGGRPSQELLELLELDGKPVATGPSQEIQLETLESAPRVVREHLPLRTRRPREIFVSGESEELDVLLPDTSGNLGGRRYPKAQGALVVEALFDPGNQVRLTFVPRLHYGQSEQRFVGHQGAFRLDTSRSRSTFESLAFTAKLGAGELLVVGCLPNRTGSLGYHFFTHECDGRRDQKLAVIRLSQTQHDDLFSPNSSGSATSK